MISKTNSLGVNKLNLKLIKILFVQIIQIVFEIHSDDFRYILQLYATAFLTCVLRTSNLNCRSGAAHGNCKKSRNYSVNVLHRCCVVNPITLLKPLRSLSSLCRTAEGIFIPPVKSLKVKWHPRGSKTIQIIYEPHLHAVFLVYVCNLLRRTPLQVSFFYTFI